jgi:hypothetical protein
MGRTGVAVAALLILVGCGGGTTNVTPNPPATPATSATSVEPTTPSGPQPAMGQTVLSTGPTYYPAHFEPRITFTLKDTWWLEGEDRWSVVMTPGSSYQSEENVVIIDVQRVFEPSNQRKPVPAPQDLVGWFLHHPGFHLLTTPHAVEIGGVRGTEFDLKLVTAPLCPRNPNLPLGTRCWLISPFRPGDPFSPTEAAIGPPFAIITTDRGPEINRLEILNVEGHRLLIAFGDYPKTFPATVRLFERLIQSIRFG